MKKGQVFSIDLVFAVIIFLIAIALFYNNIRFIPEKKIEQRLSIDPDFLFSNIKTNAQIYDNNHPNKISFIDNFKIDEQKIKNFAAMKYEDFKDILFSNLIITGLDVDACLFFSNRFGFIIPIDSNKRNITGIGNATNAFIVVEEKSDENGEDINCGAESRNKKAKPYCYGNYEFSRLYSRPMLRKTNSLWEITSMNILICAREKDSTLFMPKPGETTQPTIPITPTIPTAPTTPIIPTTPTTPTAPTTPTTPTAPTVPTIPTAPTTAPTTPITPTTPKENITLGNITLPEEKNITVSGEKEAELEKVPEIKIIYKYKKSLLWLLILIMLLAITAGIIIYLTKKKRKNK